MVLFTPILSNSYSFQFMEENKITTTKTSDYCPKETFLIVSEPFISYSSKNPLEEFDHTQELAELTKGIVMPNLNNKTIEIIKVNPHKFNSDTPLVEARKWAEKHLLGIYTSHRNTIEQFDYQISKSAIKKYIQSSASSESVSVHLSVLKVLPKIIDASVEVEIHADYAKVNGIRSLNNPVDKNVLIHRFYGVIEVLDLTYRVKTTIKEYRDINFINKPYSFEVIKIELLDLSNSSISVASHPNSLGGLITNVANILQNIEKSYDKGKFLLEESRG